MDESKVDFMKSFVLTILASCSDVEPTNGTGMTSNRVLSHLHAKGKQNCSTPKRGVKL
jgi:hypothetical protein